jgi:hypothetical protein
LHISSLGPPPSEAEVDDTGRPSSQTRINPLKLSRGGGATLKVKYVAVGTVAALTLSASAWAQSAKNVVGTWEYVSAETTAPVGKKSPDLRHEPEGHRYFEANGHSALIVSRSDAPKFASNNRMSSISRFGTYTLNEADKTTTFPIRTSTSPNWHGIDQKRPFTASGRLKYAVPAASGGGTADVVLMRIK